MAGEKTLYLEIPLDEFERLHARIKELEAALAEDDRTVKRLREGWSDAEAQNAVLRDAIKWNEEQRSIQAREIDRLGVLLTHEVGFRETAEARIALLEAAIDRAHPHAEPKPGCALCEMELP